MTKATISGVIILAHCLHVFNVGLQGKTHTVFQNCYVGMLTDVRVQRSAMVWKELFSASLFSNFSTRWLSTCLLKTARVSSRCMRHVLRDGHRFSSTKHWWMLAILSKVKRVWMLQRSIARRRRMVCIDAWLVFCLTTSIRRFWTVTSIRKASSGLSCRTALSSIVGFRKCFKICRTRGSSTQVYPVVTALTDYHWLGQGRDANKPTASAGFCSKPCVPQSKYRM